MDDIANDILNAAMHIDVAGVQQERSKLGRPKPAPIAVRFVAQ
jgi:hypothetical protein